LAISGFFAAADIAQLLPLLLILHFRVIRTVSAAVTNVTAIA